MLTLPARASTLPGGTVLWVRSLEPVSSNDKAGKKFAAQLDTDLIVKGKVTAPAGSKVYGRVESSRSAEQSKLELSLTQIVVNGRPVAIATESYEDSGARTGRKTAVAAAERAVGAAAGAAVGTATGLIGQRKPVVAPPGTPFEFRLARPVSL